MTKFQPAGPPRFQHQKAALKKMIATGGTTALLMDPGTGKTACVLDYASLLALKSPRREARVLVVAPLAAVDTWVMQAEQFVSHQVTLWAEALGGSIMQRAEALGARGGNPIRTAPVRGPRSAWQGPRAAHHHRAFIQALRGAPGAPEPTTAEGPDGLGTELPRLVLEVTNLDTFKSRAQHRSGTMADVMVDAVRRFKPDLVVVDESHLIKGAGANASRCLSRLTSFVPRRMILTGTVQPHGPLDVFAQWRFLEPYAFGTKLADGSTKIATMGGFRSHYAKLGGWMGKEVVGYKNLDHMQQIMARNAVVVRKEDAIDLPPTTSVTVPVELSTAEKRAYQEMTNQLATRILDQDGASVSATTNNRLTQMMRLRQITSGFLPDDTGTIQLVGKSKANTIRSIVHDNLAGEKRIVIFAVFTHEIELLRRTLAREGTEVQVIGGSTAMEDRALIRKRFGPMSSDPDQRMVLIAQVKTMSLAVNELVTASHAIFASLSQQRDDLIQAMARLDRQGQTRPVTFHFAVAPSTVDQVILDSHEKRTDLETAVLRHVREYADGSR